MKSSLYTVTLIVAVTLHACGSSSSGSKKNLLDAGDCTVVEGDQGYWDITKLPALGIWARTCDRRELSTTSGKFFRFVGLRVAEDSKVSLLPFSDGEDNGFNITIDHATVSVSFSPFISTKQAESFAIDMSNPTNICVEIHGLTGEAHVWGYSKGTESEGCSSADRTSPSADWQLEQPALDEIGGLYLGFRVEGTVEFERIVVTNRAGGTEAGNPGE